MTGPQSAGMFLLPGGDDSFDVRFADLPQIEGPTGSSWCNRWSLRLEAGMIADRTKKALAAAPVILSAWGTYGTRGEAAKARELYAKAHAGGIREAKDRLEALRR